MDDQIMIILVGLERELKELSHKEISELGDLKL